MTKITVVTITYNAEDVLQWTLDSVLRQTHPCVEHLIVDGASKDKTLALATSYKQRSDAAGNGHEVVVLSEPDRGIYDAMNKGLARATGDYIVFMNAGDSFHADNTLEEVAKAHARMSSGLLCPHRHCPTNALRPAISLFGRCGLVHKSDEKG